MKTYRLKKELPATPSMIVCVQPSGSGYALPINHSLHFLDYFEEIPAPKEETTLVWKKLHPKKKIKLAPALRKDNSGYYIDWHLFDSELSASNYVIGDDKLIRWPASENLVIEMEE